MSDLPAVDCHAHVFCPSSHRLDLKPSYVPLPNELGGAADFIAVLDAQRVSHGLLVSAEPYGTDNSCMLSALATAPDRFRGIALVDPDIADPAFDRLCASRIVGARFNLVSSGMRQLTHPSTHRLFARMRERGWVLQVHGAADQWAEALPLLRRSGLRVVIDHFGRPDIVRGRDQPGFQAVLELGRSTDAVVKLSAPFRSSRMAYPYEDVDPFIEAVIDAFGLGRCVWGSDWPFVLHRGRVDYGPQFECLARWLPNVADRRQVLWTSPSQIFGFA
jgi:predicted TIM-barrel fold metal-dependent hydrolase